MVGDEATRHVHDLDQIDLIAVRGRAGIFPRQLMAVGEEVSRPMPPAEAVRRGTGTGGEKVANGRLALEDSGAEFWLNSANQRAFENRNALPGASLRPWMVSAPALYAWRVNVNSRGRALLLLFLFSDVGPMDAPKRIRAGSHQDVARLLEPAGDAGVSHIVPDATDHRPVTQATGDAGTVYLCHPFLVHAAQPHRGSAVRFLAQPPLHPAEPLQLNRSNGNYSSVEIAIRRALKNDPG
jgi:hypothetical protein